MCERAENERQRERERERRVCERKRRQNRRGANELLPDDRVGLISFPERRGSGGAGGDEAEEAD